MAREQDLFTRISNEASVSGNKWQDLADLYELPRNLRGKRLLDICAGESDFTVWLLEHGAQAIAVDYLYNDLDRLHTRRTNNLLRLGNALGKIDLEIAKKRLLTDPSTAHFFKSIKSNPSSYIAASAHALPFPNDSFDLVTSYLGIFGVMDYDEKLLETSISEALRVLKRKGTLQIAPHQFVTAFSEKQINCQNRAIRQIQSNKNLRISFAVRQYQENEAIRITITKL